jgi:hypothetical protein
VQSNSKGEITDQAFNGQLILQTAPDIDTRLHFTATNQGVSVVQMGADGSSKEIKEMTFEVIKDPDSPIGLTTGVYAIGSNLQQESNIENIIDMPEGSGFADKHAVIEIKRFADGRMTFTLINDTSKRPTHIEFGAPSMQDVDPRFRNRFTSVAAMIERAQRPSLAQPPANVGGIDLNADDLLLNTANAAFDLSDFYSPVSLDLLNALTIHRIQPVVNAIDGKAW